MIYFEPVNRESVDGEVMSVVPFTHAAVGSTSSRWVLPRNEKYGHYEYTGRVLVNGIPVWVMTDLNEPKIRAEMRKVINRINTLAAGAYDGIKDLME